MRVINEIILHCSGTDVAGYDFTRMRYDHINNRGWNDIGYHFGIDWDGDIHILRPINKPGAHCKGHNRHSIGICVLGLQSFTHWQMKQLCKLLDTLCYAFSLSRKDIKPHNYYNPNKMCPVFDLDTVMKKYMEVH